MQIGMIGLGRMGGNMVRRLLRAGHQCVVYHRDPAKAQPLVDEGAVAIADLAGFREALTPPRHVWLMIPAASVGEVIEALAPHLEPGDAIIDGGNSHYRDDLVHAERLRPRGIHFVDCGTSGGIWGLERGYCLMVGGDPEVFRRLEPILSALAPGAEAAPRTPGRQGPLTPAEQGYLHCGPVGAGHFVKMVHNGIEYALMAAYAEGFNLLRHAGIGRSDRPKDAETAPLSHPEHYQYDLPIAEIAELWRRGSVIASWLLDLAAQALYEDPGLEGFAGRVADSGEGRWTALAAIESGTPTPLMTTALYGRFSSRGEADFANRLLSALRYRFGGHREQGQ